MTSYFQDQSLTQHMIREEGMRKRRNRKVFTKQDFRSFQDIGFHDNHNNEDLLMSSTELKTRKPTDRIPAKGIKHVKPPISTGADKHRILSADKARNNKLPVRNKSIERLPVSTEEIKHVLSDLKTVNDEIKLLPNGRLSLSDPPIKAGIKRVQVGEIRLRPQELRSLLSNSKISFQ